MPLLEDDGALEDERLPRALQIMCNLEGCAWNRDLKHVEDTMKATEDDMMTILGLTAPPADGSSCAKAESWPFTGGAKHRMGLKTGVRKEREAKEPGAQGPLETRYREMASSSSSSSSSTAS